MSNGFLRKANLKKGALSKQLGIKEQDNIPISLLRSIKKADEGTFLDNPTQKGKRSIFVTSKLKRRASLAITLKSFKKK